jgi:DNA-binding XRE family transcriptional regulator
MNSLRKADAQRLARVFRAARKLNGRTQSTLAKDLGIAQGTISKIESGLLMPSLSEWFVFCQLTAIPAEESFMSGYIDHGLPIQTEGVYENSSFKVPVKYRHHSSSKVRSLQPFVKYFESCLGIEKWEKHLELTKMDPDFFVVLDNQVNIGFLLDLVSTLIQNGQLKPDTLSQVTQSVRQPKTHGRLEAMYSQARSPRDLIVSFIQHSDKYERNFTFDLEETNEKKLVVSVKPLEHMRQFNYKNDVLNDFICRYKKQYFRDFSSYKGGTPVEIEETECHFHGGSQCIYKMQIA